MHDYQQRGDEARAVWTEMLEAAPTAPALVVDGITMQLGEPLFQFTSKQHWINKASNSWRARGVRAEDTVCVDALGRICTIGKHFADAERDGAYPMTVYRTRADMTPTTQQGEQADG